MDDDDLIKAIDRAHEELFGFPAPRFVLVDINYAKRVDKEHG